MSAEPRAASGSSPTGAKAAKTYPRPDSVFPRSDETCPLCKSPPNVEHRNSCPWMMWANNPEVSRG